MISGAWPNPANRAQARTHKEIRETWNQSSPRERYPPAPSPPPARPPDQRLVLSTAVRTSGSSASDAGLSHQDQLTRGPGFAWCILPVSQKAANDVTAPCESPTERAYASKTCSTDSPDSAPGQNRLESARTSCWQVSIMIPPPRTVHLHMGCKYRATRGPFVRPREYHRHLYRVQETVHEPIGRRNTRNFESHHSSFLGGKLPNSNLMSSGGFELTGAGNSLVSYFNVTSFGGTNTRGRADPRHHSRSGSRQQIQ